MGGERATVGEAQPNGNGAALEDVRRQLTGGMPKALDEWLARPRADQRYHEGTIVPMLGLRVRKRPSGLLVVGADDDPSPADLMLAYLAASEVFGARLSDVELTEFLKGATADRLVWATALLLRAIHEGDVSRLEQAIVDEMLQDPARERARNLLTDRGRRLIVPQLQLLVAAASVLSLPWSADDPVDAPDVTRALILALHVGDALQRPLDRDEDILFGNVSSGLAVEIVANQLFNSTTQLRADMARHESVWHRHVREVAADAHLPDLAVVFEQTTGVPIDVFEAVGFGLYAAKSEQPPFVERSWFSTTTLRLEQVEAVESMVCVTPAQLRARLESDLGGDLVTNRWQLAAFSQWPLLRFDEDRWLVHSPQLLVDRFFSGLAFFDAWSRAGANKPRVWNAWGLATERYGQEVLAGLAGDRVYREDQLQQVIGTTGQRIADAVVDYGHRWVVLDFSSRRPSQQLARNADPAALRREIELLIDEKGKQLQATIDVLRQREEDLTGVNPQRAKRFTPAIVMHSQWPRNPITYELVQQRLQELELLQEDDVDPLEVVTIEELEMVEALQESGGPSLITLLDSKRSGPLFRMGLKDHILLIESIEVGLSRRIRDLFNAGVQRMVETFGFADDQVASP